MAAASAMIAAAGVLQIGSIVAAQQSHFVSGQNVVPVFEGWERNADGTINMVFGYMNRNYEEEVDIPVGVENNIEPGGVDQGQPTHFYQRRQQFVFKVKVPKDWGKKDLVWTLNFRGRVEKAYGSMLPIWELGNLVYQQNRGGPADITDEVEPDEAPHVALTSPNRVTTPVGKPVTLTAAVTDDGHPAPAVPAGGGRRGQPPSAAPPRDSDGAIIPPAAAPPAPAGGRGQNSGPAAGRGQAPGTAGTGAAAGGRGQAATPIPPVPSGASRQSPLTTGLVRLERGVRLGMTWLVYRGSDAGTVTFDPMHVAVANGQAVTKVTFSKPGSYMLRGYADDGWLITPVDVNVTVTAN